MILFVGNLNRLTTQKEVTQLLEGFGQVTKSILMVDKITRRSRGCAYVDMLEPHSGENAVYKLNNTLFMGSSIVVEKATTRQLTAIEWK
jgi:RNA recognition motif-containing protein